MDPLTLLKDDHQRVKDLLTEATAAGPEQMRELFAEIKSELETHSYIEEEVFYPTLEKRPELKDLVLEAYAEHDLIKTLLEELDELPEGDETFGPKLQVLMENVTHHAEEEEEGKIFPIVRKTFDADALDAMGEQLQEEKDDYILENAEDVEGAEVEDEEEDQAGGGRTRRSA